MMHSMTTRTKGFTLVETLVAILILTIAITGPYTLVQGVLRSSYIARDELVASALAQEAMEYVRYIRDSNYIYTAHGGTGRGWLYGLDGSTGPNCYTYACTVDVPQQTVTSCGGPTCISPLYISS